MILREFNRDSELADQRRLFKECFPETSGDPIQTEDHYLWKFADAPQQPPSYEYGAYDSGEMIGYYAAINYPYMMNSSKLSAGMVCDVMTGVKARGKGVFTKMGIFATDQLKASGVDFATGYPIRPEVIPGHVKAGWNKAFKLPLYIKFLSVRHLFGKKGIGWLSWLGDLALLAINKPYKLCVLSGKYKVRRYAGSELDQIDGLEGFLKNWVSQQRIALSKSVEFLKWRLGAPNREYTILTARWGKEIVGYAILRRIDKEGISCLGILDFCTLEGFEDASTAMLAEMESYAKETGAEALLLMFSSHCRRKYRLHLKGFLRSPFTFWFIIKLLSSSLAEDIALDERNWHLGWIDSDDL